MLVYLAHKLGFKGWWKDVVLFAFHHLINEFFNEEFQLFNQNSFKYKSG